MATISITDATATQLADFAQTFLGLDVTFREGKAKIMSKLVDAGYDKDTIETEEPSPVTLAPASTSAPSDENEEYVTVMIPKQAGKPRLEFVSVNGVGIYIERGKPQRVRKRYAHALDLAQEETYDPSSAGLQEPSFSPAFAHSIVSVG